MAILVQGIQSEAFEYLRAGGVDANGQAPLLRKAEGHANPCRHCLALITPGDDMLVLSYRPFPGPSQPYAETGPIFLHARACTRYIGASMPDWFAFLDPAVIRGYDANAWIRYETGAIVSGRDLARASEHILHGDAIAFVHIRSKFGCFQCQVERAS